MMLNVLPVLPRRTCVRWCRWTGLALRHVGPERPVPPRHQPQQPPAPPAGLKAPEIIARNEKRMLQEAVDSLLDNGRRGKP